MSNSDTVTHLDLDIAVEAAHTEHFKKWVLEFEENNEVVLIRPRMRKGRLLINSKDFVDFYGFMEPKVFSDLERARFIKSVKTQMESHLNLSLKNAVRYHYKWCLTAISNFEMGRHRDKVD